MSIEAISTLSSDQARADSAALRLAAALSLEQADPTTDPSDVERGRAAAAAARADLAQADAAVSADEAAATSVVQPQNVNAPPDVGATQAPSEHIVELVV